MTNKSITCNLLFYYWTSIWPTDFTAGEACVVNQGWWVTDHNVVFLICGQTFQMVTCKHITCMLTAEFIIYIL